MRLFGPPNVQKMQAKGNVEGLIKALVYKKDAGVRRAAADALGTMGAREGAEPLVAALKDQDHQVRQAAAGALEKIGGASALALRPLVAALKDTAVRQVAAETLEKIGAPAVDPLVVALEDTAVRQVAAETLEKIGAPAVGPLVVALKDDPLRQAAAETLEKIGAPAVGPLVAALEDEVPRSVVVEILGQIGDSQALEPLLAVLKSDEMHTRQAAAAALDKMGWQPGRDEAGVAYWIAQGQWNKCVELGGLAVGPLVVALGDKSVRQAAAGALEEIGSPAVEPLIAALQDKDWNVRRAAAGALGRIGDVQALEPLMAALDDKSARVRGAAAKALGELGAPAMEALVAILQDQDSPMRQTVIKASGQIGDTRMVEPLVAALNQADLDTCDAIVEALKKMGLRVQVDKQERKVTLFAFFAHATGGPTVLSTSDQQAWIKRLRSEFRLPKARVEVIGEGQWDAPPLSAVDDKTVQKNLAAIQGAIRKVLAARGVPETRLDSLTDRITKLSNPLTRLVVFVVPRVEPLEVRYVVLLEDGSAVMTNRAFEEAPYGLKLAKKLFRL